MPPGQVSSGGSTSSREAGGHPLGVCRASYTVEIDKGGKPIRALQSAPSGTLPATSIYSSHSGVSGGEVRTLISIQMRRSAYLPTSFAAPSTRKYRTGERRLHTQTRTASSFKAVEIFDIADLHSKRQANSSAVPCSYTRSNYTTLQAPRGCYQY